MSEELGPGMQKVMDTIQKLLNLAAKNTNAEESASAAAKAQELLTKYNLDAAAIDKHGAAVDGRREEVKTRGGFYEWQRQLWTAVAQLNFCLYWTQSYFDKEWTGRQRLTERQQYYHDDVKSRVVTGKMQKRHCLIGRIVNTRATIFMAGYLEEAIERLAREHIRGDTKQLYSREANSFRFGAMEEVVDKLNERYRERLSQERREEAKRQKAANEASAKGHSTSTAVTLSNYIQSEKDANRDFQMGEAGYTARIAAERAQAEAEYTQWAAENPEEARKKEEEREKASKRYRESKGRTIPVDWSAYNRGKAAGKGISIDQQMKNPVAGKLK